MKLPFYFRKSKPYIKDGKLWIEIKMNNFDKLCLAVSFIIGRIIKYATYKYF